MHVVAVDVSSGAILRRIGLAGSATPRQGRQNPKPRLIDWSAVDLQSRPTTSAVRLTVPRRKLALLHPADIAEIVHELTPEERAAVFDALEDELAADTLEEMHPAYQASLLQRPARREGQPRCSTRCRPTTPPTCWPTCPSDRRAPLALMEEKATPRLRELLTYPEHSAGGIMTTDFAVVPPEVTAAEAIERLREQEPEAETVYYIYVIDRASACSASSRCATCSRGPAPDACATS